MRGWDGEAVRQVILVQHSAPLVDPTRPASAWPLSEAGAAAATKLACALRPYAPGLIVTSTERKAVKTGRIIADLLGLATEIDEDLNEQGIGTVPYLPDRAAFLARVQEQFHRPNEPVQGVEPATAAGRLVAAVGRHLHTEGTLSIFVSRGRIMASFLARMCSGSPPEIW